MKATALWKAMMLAALFIASTFGMGLKAQDTRFITNEEVTGQRVTAKTIYRQDGSQLYRHLRYEYTYDDQERLASKTAAKWDAARGEWEPYFRMTYTYGPDDITLSYARWNEAHKAYDKDVSRESYERDEAHMPKV